MKTKKTLFATLIAVAGLLTATTAQADGITQVSVNGVSYNGATNQTQPEWSWDAATNTFSLNADLAGGIKFEGEGDVTLNVTGTAATASIYARNTGSLSLTGDGTLSVENDFSNTETIYTKGDFIMTSGTLNLAATGSNSYGIRASGDVNISGTATLRTNPSTTGEGIFANNNLIIGGNAVVDIAGGSTMYYAISANGAITISGGTVTAKYLGSKLGGVALCGADGINITGGTLTTGEAGSSNGGIIGNLSVSGAATQVTVNGNMDYNNNLTVADGTVTVTGLVFGNISATGGTVSVNGETLLMNEAEVVSIISPVSTRNMSDAEEVTVYLRNNGLTPISNFDLTLKVNGVAIATEKYTGTLNYKEDNVYSFTAVADLSTPGDYSIEVTLTLPGDEKPENNTASKIVTHVLCEAINSFPWTEGFETEAALVCWTQEVVSGWGAEWFRESGTASAYAGETNVLQEGQDYGDVSRLITPRLDLSDLSDPALNFWHVQEADEGDQDELRVYYKTSASGEWQLLKEYTEEIDDWTEATITLPNPSADYYIAFEGTVKYGYGIGLDEVTVRSSSSNSLNTVVLDAVNIYPNPTAGKLIIKNEKVKVGEVIIYDIQGKKLSIFDSQLSTLEIDLSAYADGMYFVQVNGTIHKIIKQ